MEILLSVVVMLLLALDIDLYCKSTLWVQSVGGEDHTGSSANRSRDAGGCEFYDDTQRAPFFRCLSSQRAEWNDESNESRESHSRAIECGCLTSNWGNFTAIPVPHPFIIGNIYANDVDGE